MRAEEVAAVVWLMLASVIVGASVGLAIRAADPAAAHDTVVVEEPTRGPVV